LGVGWNSIWNSEGERGSAARLGKGETMMLLEHNRGCHNKTMKDGTGEYSSDPRTASRAILWGWETETSKEESFSILSPCHPLASHLDFSVFPDFPLLHLILKVHTYRAQSLQMCQKKSIWFLIGNRFSCNSFSCSSRLSGNITLCLMQYSCKVAWGGMG
jgi:hypothetical protein